MLPRQIRLVLFDLDEFAAASRNLRAAGGRLRWAGLKQFADGSLGGHTAATTDRGIAVGADVGDGPAGLVQRSQVVLEETEVCRGGEVVEVTPAAGDDVTIASGSVRLTNSTPLLGSFS